MVKTSWCMVLILKWHLKTSNICPVFLLQNGSYHLHYELQITNGPTTRPYCLVFRSFCCILVSGIRIPPVLIFFVYFFSSNVSAPQSKPLSHHYVDAKQQTSQTSQTIQTSPAPLVVAPTGNYLNTLIVQSGQS